MGISPLTLGDVYHNVLVDDLAPYLEFITYSGEDGRCGPKTCVLPSALFQPLRSGNVADD